MRIAAIICEYNPLHNGHARHIRMTKDMAPDTDAVVCVMSGNFVQRGDFAVFGKHARAHAGVLCGADLVLELPVPYAVASAERFARAGVHILSSLGLPGVLSFGSESGDCGALSAVAGALLRPEAAERIQCEMADGIAYAAAVQNAASALLGQKAELLRAPNNLLAVEYLKALCLSGSALRPVTVRRVGSVHDGEAGESATAVRNRLRAGAEDAWTHVPPAAAAVYLREAAEGRGPVFSERHEDMLLARLRMLQKEDFEALPDATEGLGLRLMRFAQREGRMDAVIRMTKTKRYAESRIRRMLLCAALGIRGADGAAPPPYIRALAMNATGQAVLRRLRGTAALPVITKPASVRRLDARARRIFDLEAAAGDFYALGFRAEEDRAGGGEWRKSPIIVP